LILLKRKNKPWTASNGQPRQPCREIPESPLSRRPAAKIASTTCSRPVNEESAVLVDQDVERLAAQRLEQLLASGEKAVEGGSPDARSSRNVRHRRIGRVTARRMAEAGYAVIVTGRDENPARRNHPRPRIQLGRQRHGRPEFEGRPYRGLGAYAQSKLALLMFAIELANRLRGSGITLNCVHPGGANSNLGRDVGTRPGARLMGHIMTFLNNSSENAAEAQLYLATSPDVAELTGAYVINRTPPRPGRANRLANDADARRRLWDRSLAMIELPAT
jgi:hypothetical protein